MGPHGACSSRIVFQSLWSLEDMIWPEAQVTRILQSRSQSPFSCWLAPRTQTLANPKQEMARVRVLGADQKKRGLWGRDRGFTRRI